MIKGSRFNPTPTNGIGLEIEVICHFLINHESTENFDYVNQAFQQEH